uniref:Uncharacterized protein n=1 Tax=Parascaris equorum TaxID=6256 RepID=A0A914RMB3_PAREQ
MSKKIGITVSRTTLSSINATCKNDPTIDGIYLFRFVTESRNHIERRSAAAILLKSGCDESRRERRILIAGEPICKPFCVLNATVVSIYSRHNCKQSYASQLCASTFIIPCGLEYCTYIFARLCTNPRLVLTH